MSIIIFNINNVYNTQSTLYFIKKFFYEKLTPKIKKKKIFFVIIYLLKKISDENFL